MTFLAREGVSVVRKAEAGRSRSSEFMPKREVGERSTGAKYVGVVETVALAAILAGAFGSLGTFGTRGVTRIAIAAACLILWSVGWGVFSTFLGASAPIVCGIAAAIGMVVWFTQTWKR